MIESYLSNHPKHTLLTLNSYPQPQNTRPKAQVYKNYNIETCDGSRNLHQNDPGITLAKYAKLDQARTQVLKLTFWEPNHSSKV